MGVSRPVPSNAGPNPTLATPFTSSPRATPRATQRQAGRRAAPRNRQASRNPSRDVPPRMRLHESSSVAQVVRRNVQRLRSVPRVSEPRLARARKHKTGICRPPPRSLRECIATNAVRFKPRRRRNASDAPTRNASESPSAKLGFWQGFDEHRRRSVLEHVSTEAESKRCQKSRSADDLPGRSHLTSHHHNGRMRGPRRSTFPPGGGSIGGKATTRRSMRPAACNRAPTATGSDSSPSKKRETT